MRIDDVARMLLGTFVRPAEEASTEQPRVEAFAHDAAGWEPS
jgi:hypothetical protein